MGGGALQLGVRWNTDRRGTSLPADVHDEEPRLESFRPGLCVYCPLMFWMRFCILPHRRHDGRVQRLVFFHDDPQNDREILR